MRVSTKSPVFLPKFHLQERIQAYRIQLALSCTKCLRTLQIDGCFLLHSGVLPKSQSQIASVTKKSAYKIVRVAVIHSQLAILTWLLLADCTAAILLSQHLFILPQLESSHRLLHLVPRPGLATLSDFRGDDCSWTNDTIAASCHETGALEFRGVSLQC